MDESGCVGVCVCNGCPPLLVSTTLTSQVHSPALQRNDCGYSSVMLMILATFLVFSYLLVPVLRLRKGREGGGICEEDD